MKSWKKRALALTMAALVVLSGCTFPFGQGNDGDGAPVDNVDVSDAYFGLAWYRSGTTLNPVMDGTEVNSMLREALYEGLFEIKTILHSKTSCARTIRAMEPRSALR